MFSISIPVCGQAEYLPTALESLRVQSCPFQLAVLDATPNNSVQVILDRYRDIINYGYHYPDAGQSMAIQEGWNNTSGEIVAWLNADDYYFPDTFAMVEKVFRERPDVDVVFGHGVYVTADNVFQMYFPAISENITLLKKGCTICQPSCFVRRTAMEKVGGLDTSLQYTMDWDFWLRLYKFDSTFYFIDYPISVVRVYNDTKTLSRSKKRYYEITNILKDNTNWFNQKKSLILFYHYDLSHNKKGLVDFFVCTVLSFFRYFLRPIEKKPVIKGLECWTNYIKEQCQILLPWYSTKVPDTVSITVDRCADISLTFLGKEVHLDLCDQDVESLGDEKKCCTYKAKLNGFSGNLIVLNLRSNDGPLRLISLNII